MAAATVATVDFEFNLAAGDATPEALAAEFIKVLNEWLTPEQLDDVRAKNATPEYSNGCCATQDHIDANMAMLEAWTEVTGNDSIDGDSEADCALWNDAWAIARAKEFRP